MVDVARLPVDPKAALRAWQVTLNDGRQQKLGLAKILSADHGWIKFQQGDGKLAMFSTVHVLCVEQVEA